MRMDRVGRYSNNRTRNDLSTFYHGRIVDFDTDLYAKKRSSETIFFKSSNAFLSRAFILTDCLKNQSGLKYKSNNITPTSLVG